MTRRWLTSPLQSTSGLRASGSEMTVNTARVKVREVIRLLENDGWALVNQEGSHRQFKHPSKTGRVTVSGKNHENDAISRSH